MLNNRYTYKPIMNVLHRRREYNMFIIIIKKYVNVKPSTKLVLSYVSIINIQS